MHTLRWSGILMMLFFSLHSAAQKKKEWTILFDGTLNGKLRGYQMKEFPVSSWRVENDALVTVTGVPNIDLVTAEEYKDFELEFEWKVSKAGNGGVFFHVQENARQESGNGNSPNWLDNYEMQILDDIDFYDKDPKRSAGALYDLIAPVNKTLKPVGEYNKARLMVKGSHVEHWLNGNKVVEYEMGSDGLKQIISASKFSENPAFAKTVQGRIMFQHHGQQIWLRRIRVRRL